MKNKFKYLIKYSLKKKIDTKWFKAVNILLCLLLIFLMNMDYIINFFGGDFDSHDKIYIVDNANSYQSFENYFNTLSANFDYDNYELILDNSILNKTADLEDEIIVVIEKDNLEYLKGEVISYDTVSKTTFELISSSLNALKSELVLASSGLSADEIARLTSPVNVSERILNADAKDNQTKETLSAVITTILIVPFFILIVTMVQMLGAEINDEKTSRGMEVIISSVPAKMHFLSKVIASISYFLIQGALMFSYGILAMLLRKLFTNADAAIGVGGIISETIKALSEAGVFTLLLKGSIILIILFVVSFIAYAIVSATLASMTTNNEDFQQLQTPLMIIMMVGYYVALMSFVFDGSLFINILAHIPLLSVMIAPTLYLMGEMTLLSLIGSTAITVIATYFLYKYGLRIYKVGILNYSSSKLWRKMFKSLKKVD